MPAPPRNVQVEQINSSSIKVTWEPPADSNNEAAEVFGYNVYKFQIVNDQIVSNVRRAVAIVDRNVSEKEWFWENDKNFSRKMQKNQSNFGKPRNKMSPNYGEKLKKGINFVISQNLVVRK